MRSKCAVAYFCHSQLSNRSRCPIKVLLEAVYWRLFIGSCLLETAYWLYQRAFITKAALIKPLHKPALNRPMKKHHLLPFVTPFTDRTLFLVLSRLTSLFGYDEKDLVGYSFFQYIHASDAFQLFNSFQKREYFAGCQWHMRSQSSF